MEPWRREREIERRGEAEREACQVVSFKESVHRGLRDPIPHRRNQVLLATNLLQCLGYGVFVGSCEVFVRGFFQEWFCCGNLWSGLGLVN